VLGRKYKTSWKCESSLSIFFLATSRFGEADTDLLPGRTDGKWPNQLKVFGSGGSKPPAKSLKTLPEVPEGRETLGRERTQSSAQDGRVVEGEGSAKAGRRRSFIESSA